MHSAYTLPHPSCLCHVQVIGAGDLPLGGFTRFNQQGHEDKTGPYFLQQAGYRTGLIGKR